MKTLSPDGPLIHPGASNPKNRNLVPTQKSDRTRSSSTRLSVAYSYCTRLCDIANTTLGKFVNVAAMVRIGPTDHPMCRAESAPFPVSLGLIIGLMQRTDTAFFAAREARRTTIGHGRLDWPRSHYTA